MRSRKQILFLCGLILSLVFGDWVIAADDFQLTQEIMLANQATSVQDAKEDYQLLTIPISTDQAPDSEDTKGDSEIEKLNQRVKHLEELLKGQVVQSGMVLDKPEINQIAPEEEITEFITEEYLPSEYCDICDSKEDKYPTIGIDGFIQFDFVWFDETDESRAFYGDIADSTAVRRARFAFTGDVHENIGYKFDMDFAATGHPSYRDMIIQFRERSFADIVVLGFGKIPFQLEALNSAREFTFFERAPFFTFAPFRQIGIGANGTLAEKRATWAVAGFRSGTDGFAVAQSDDGYGFAIRSTALPLRFNNENTQMHVGLNYSYLSPAEKTIRYDSQLSFFVDEEGGGSSNFPPLVDTGDISSGGVNLFNMELAGTFEYFHIQTELTYALVDQVDGESLTFYGGYSSIGLFLTDDYRPYDKQNGVFGGVVPKNDVMCGGLGAWEIAFRGTYLSLNSKDIAGGRLKSTEFILNWYLTKRVSMKFDYTRGFVSNKGVDDFNIDSFGSRLQIIF